jgi:hypothetical protein
MNPKSTILAAFVAAAFASSNAFAQSPNTPNPPAPPAPDMAGNAPSPKMSPDTKVESDYRAAQNTCNGQPAATRDQCLRDAKTKYDRDLRTSRMNSGTSPMTNGSKSGGGNSTSGSAGTAGDNGGNSGGTSSGTGTGSGTGQK